VGVPDRATLADFFRRRTGEDLLFMPSCAASVCCAVKNLTGWVCATVPDLDANTQWLNQFMQLNYSMARAKIILN
jgi:hypothetical protein